MSDDESDRPPRYVRVMEKEGAEDDMMELPREKDDTVLLSTIQAQFPDAIGLKYKPSGGGGWRGNDGFDIGESPVFFGGI